MYVPQSNFVPVATDPVVTPNVLAPLYAFDAEKSEYERHRKQQELLRQAVNMLTSPTGFRETEENRQLLRQSGIVNMFFFLRWIAGYANPFTRLTPELHLDMCNFYQVSRKPGTRAGGFISRKHFKSSLWTYGGTAWDILRDPDWEMVLASNIIDRSIEFNGYIQEIFSNNELVMWLYPEWILPEGRSLHVNARETRVPNKRGNRPNVATVAVGGSIQGVHAKSEFKVDDLVGEHMLDSMNQLGAENEKATKWAQSAVENIPTFRNQTCLFFCGTRYGPNDGYVWMWNDIKKFYGYTQGEPYTEKEDGNWVIYYRAVREDHGDGRGEQPIFSEEISNEYLDKVQRENPWQYWTQMMNMSTYSGLSEFIDYQVKDCSLDVGRDGDLFISYYDGELRKMVELPLAECDVVAACDPAASEKKKSVRTSKNAYLVYARHWSNKRFVLHLKSQFVAITAVFDWLFDGFRKFKGYVRMSAVEIQGPFKILQPVLREEQKRRQAWINFRGVSAKGDKDGRIRAYVQPLLDRGDLYAVESARAAIEGEMMVFPDGHQKDVLDALAIAEAASRRPEAPDDEDDEDEQWAQRREHMSPVSGY